MLAVFILPLLPCTGVWWVFQPIQKMCQPKSRTKITFIFEGKRWKQAKNIGVFERFLNKYFFFVGKTNQGLKVTLKKTNFYHLITIYLVHFLYKVFKNGLVILKIFCPYVVFITQKLKVEFISDFWFGQFFEMGWKTRHIPLMRIIEKKQQDNAQTANFGLGSEIYI